MYTNRIFCNVCVYITKTTRENFCRMHFYTNLKTLNFDMLSRVLHEIADIHLFLLSLLLFRCIITHFLLKKIYTLYE